MMRLRLLVGLLVLAGIAVGVAYVARTAQPVPTPIPTPKAVRSTPTYEPPATFARTTPTFKVNLDEIAPPGRGRDLLINNCSNCHNFACALVGQRTVQHWETISATHYEKMVFSVPEEDFGAIFDYLEENFNDQKPEPYLPPDFLGKGCTTAWR